MNLYSARSVATATLVDYCEWCDTRELCPHSTGTCAICMEVRPSDQLIDCATCYTPYECKDDCYNMRRDRLKACECGAMADDCCKSFCVSCLDRLIDAGTNAVPDAYGTIPSVWRCPFCRTVCDYLPTSLMIMDCIDLTQD